MRPIVVGFDESEPSFGAVRWAMDEAVRHHAPVHIVQSWRGPIVGGSTGASRGDDPIRAERRLETEMRSLARALVIEHPTVTVTTAVVASRADDALVEAAEHAPMLVVGSRGRGGFASLTLGSVSRRVVMRATCPTVVVRSPGRHGPVVVGIDGSRRSRAALAWGAAEAALRGVGLCAVLAWTDVVLVADDDPGVLPTGAGEAEARDVLWRITHEVLGAHPTTSVDLVVSDRHPTQALIDAADGAALLVVGAGRPDHAAQDLGSVAWQALHHAPCSVAVIRELPA